MFYVTFVGDPRGASNQEIAEQDPKVAEYHGKYFPKGEAVTVDDEGWIKAHGMTLRKNSHFHVEEGEAPAADEEVGDDLDNMGIRKLRKAAEAKGINHDGLDADQLREALRA